MQGSWIVHQSVGSTPCLLGKAVDRNYIRGPKYLEVNALGISIIHEMFPFQIARPIPLTWFNIVPLSVD